MLSAKTLLCAVGAAGGCCAIGVPVTLSVTGRNRIHLTKCGDSSALQEVSPTELLQGAFCWKLTSSEEQEEEETAAQHSNDTLLTSLLSSIFSNSVAEDNSWREECETGSFKWKLEKSAERGETIGEAYHRMIGYCGNTLETEQKESNTPFVEISRQSSSMQPINVCVGGKECWSDSYDSFSTSTFKNKVQDQWKTVKLYNPTTVVKAA